MVSNTPQLHFTPRKDPVPVVQLAGWAPGPVWTGGKSCPHRNLTLDHPAHKIPYIWQCSIRMLAQCYMFVSVLMIVEVNLFRTKMPVKATSAWPRKRCFSLCICLFSPLDSAEKFMSIIVSSLVSQQTHHVILILSLFLFLCLHLKRNEIKLRL